MLSFAEYPTSQRADYAVVLVVLQMVPFDEITTIPPCMAQSYLGQESGGKRSTGSRSYHNQPAA